MIEAVFPNTSINQPTEESLLEIVQFVISVMPDQIYIPILLLLWWLWSGKQWPKMVVAVPDTGGSQAVLTIAEASALREADFSALCLSPTPFSVAPTIAPQFRCAVVDIGINSEGRLKQTLVLNFSSHPDVVILLPLPTTWDAVCRLMLRPRCAYIKTFHQPKPKGPRVISSGVRL